MPRPFLFSPGVEPGDVSCARRLALRFFCGFFRRALSRVGYWRLHDVQTTTVPRRGAGIDSWDLLKQIGQLGFTFIHYKLRSNP